MSAKLAFYNRLQGPVCPILTPFTEDGSQVDHDALAKYVSFIAGSGISAIMTTVGTSRFNLLSDAEIRAVNETVTRAADNKCLVILAGPMTGNTTTNLEFADHAASQGADAFIAFFPERYYGDEPLLKFYQTLSDSSDVGIMIHEMPMRSGYGGSQQYSIDLLKRLSAMPNVYGIKEECMDAGYAYLLHRALEDDLAIIGAGSMRLYMRDYHAGARAYLVGVGSFFPRVAQSFYNAVTANDMGAAHSIVRTYEEPYFDLAVSLGWHVALKETLDILGLMPGWERDPLPRLTTEQRNSLHAKIEELGWLDLDPLHAPGSIGS